MSCARPSSESLTPNAQACIVTSSNEAFNRWIRRSAADLQMMITETPHGPYPYAGIPWFSTPFGRDGLITALELLWAARVARGVLTFLADTQATTRSDAQDAQPGKILHEMRGGEMAALGEVPFGRYYGSADATPLFVMLAHAYFERTGDRDSSTRCGRTFSRRWTGWPTTATATATASSSTQGAAKRGSSSKAGRTRTIPCSTPMARWPSRRSRSARFRGTRTRAWKGAARLAGAARRPQRRRAGGTRRPSGCGREFEEAFWCDDLGTYALALDGDKQPCRVRTSNPGHCLFTGIRAGPCAHASPTR